MTAARPRLHEFLAEARQTAGGIGDDLLALEQGRDPSSRSRVDRVFRAVHSVKGGAGFFGCGTIEQLTHAMETVLEPWRERPEPPCPAVVDALLAGADRVLALLDDV